MLKKKVETISFEQSIFKTISHPKSTPDMKKYLLGKNLKNGQKIKLFACMMGKQKVVWDFPKQVT